MKAKIHNKIHNQWDKNQTYSNAGNQEYKVYERQYNPDGTIKLFVSQTRNIYNEIQEANDGTSFKDMAKKYLMKSKQEIIQDLEKQPYYDTTIIPENKIDFMNKQLEFKEKMENLEKNIENIKKGGEKIIKKEQPKKIEKGEAENE